MTRDQLMSAVLGRAWAITPTALRAELTRLQQLSRAGTQANGEDVAAVSAVAEEGVEYSWRLRVREGVGQIRIYNTLVSTSSYMGWWFDTYDVIADEISSALADPSVKALILTFDSPGGHVAGCQELARIIRAARGTKPIVAFVEGDACSAAYWVACACDEIVIAPTAMAGCLGVQWAYLDATKMLEDWGLEEIVITSSQTPAKNRPPTTEEGRNDWQVVCDDLADEFLNEVAAFRGVSRDHVDAHFGMGAILVGARAVAARLADRLGTYESLRAELASGNWQRANAGDAATTTAAVAAQTTRHTMPAMPRTSRRRQRAAAFEANAEVRVLVTRDVGVAEGDIGTIEEVRDGSFYRVAIGDGVYAWLGEDEIEAVTAPPAEDDPSDDPDASEDDDEEKDKDDEQNARRAPNAFQAALRKAAAAERTRIVGILKLAPKASLDALLTCITDSGCTPEGAAHRLLTGALKGGRPVGLQQLAADEAALTRNGPISPNGAPTPDGDSAVAKRAIATFAQLNPNAVKTSGRS